MTDKNAEAVRQKMLDRSEVGLTKYGITTERTDIDFVGWLDHLQQELMDGAIYAQAAMAAHTDTGTIEQEIRQVRARLARVEKERDELLTALREVVRISDRKHDAWDRAHAAIAKVQP